MTVNKTSKDRIRRWRQNTPDAFLAWVADIKPRILINNRYEPFVPTEDQLALIKEILAPGDKVVSAEDPTPVKALTSRSHHARKPRPIHKKATEANLSRDRRSSFKHSLSMLVEPRRHGKSTIFALICLWLFTSRKNTTIQLLGNTESHCRRVQFSTVRKIINNTPTLKKLIPTKNQYVFELLFPALGNVLQMSPGNNPSTSFGEKIDVLWVSDLHACADLQPFNALQASLLDSKDSLLLIDTNVDTTDGTVHLLQKEAETDPTIFCHHTQYADIEDYCKNAPPWISRAKARRLQKTTLEVDFRRDILGLRSAATNSLFPTETIKKCKSPYKYPVDDIADLIKGRAYKVGGGLDRSKSLLGAAMGRDNTIWTTVLKVANPENEEPEIYILNQVNIIPNTGNMVKKTILKDHERYNLDACVLESYEVMDLAPWLESQHIPVEIITPHSTRQNASFPELARIAREGRLHFPEDMKDLADEMSTFVYKAAPRGEGYAFGHSSKKFKDDRIFSLNWALYSLRSEIMSLYKVGHVTCTSKSRNRHLCYLLGGNLALACAEGCSAAVEVDELYQGFLRYQMDSPLTLQEFFRTHVKIEGCRVYQGV